MSGDVDKTPVDELLIKVGDVVKLPLDRQYPYLGGEPYVVTERYRSDDGNKIVYMVRGASGLRTYFAERDLERVL